MNEGGLGRHHDVELRKLCEHVVFPVQLFQREIAMHNKKTQRIGMSCFHLAMFVWRDADDVRTPEDLGGKEMYLKNQASRCTIARSRGRVGAPGRAPQGRHQTLQSA